MQRTKEPRNTRTSMPLLFTVAIKAYFDSKDTSPVLFPFRFAHSAEEYTHALLSDAKFSDKENMETLCLLGIFGLTSAAYDRDRQVLKGAKADYDCVCRCRCECRCHCNCDDCTCDYGEYSLPAAVSVLERGVEHEDGMSWKTVCVDTGAVPTVEPLGRQ